MAPSKCCLAFFLAIALLAGTPQPSAAVRADPPASSTTGATPPSKWRLKDILPSCWPFPPIFGPPSTPTPPAPCKPQPKECLPAMTGMLPCKDFITNKTAPAPPYPSKCCDGFKSLMEDAPGCLGHLEDGEFDKIMSADSAPIEKLNFVDLVDICHNDGSDGTTCDGPMPPVRAKPELKDCLSTMMGIMPCKDFLTNKTAPAPPYPSKCCDGFKSLMEDSPICICHLYNGEFDKFMSARIDDFHFLDLMNICHTNDDASDYSCNGPVPPVRAPPPPTYP